MELTKSGIPLAADAVASCKVW